VLYGRAEAESNFNERRTWLFLIQGVRLILYLSELISHVMIHDRTCVQGPVYQRIDTKSSILDNVVEIQVPHFFFPFVDGPVAVRACLRHTFSIKGDSSVVIVYESTTLEPLVNGCVASPTQPNSPRSISEYMHRSKRGKSFDGSTNKRSSKLYE
jgi:hypothetical protein